MSAPSSAQVIALAKAHGFDHAGIARMPPDAAIERFDEWLARDFHGDMTWLATHGAKRTDPAALIPGTLSVISVRLDYWPDAAEPWSVLDNGTLGYVSRYALGRDYHRVLRQRLQKLADALCDAFGPFGYRVFTDSAPVLEKPLAERAGLGWIGKHTNLIDTRAGSWFFLGEIYTDLELAESAAASAHCGRCTRCISACPTAAIVKPYVLDARRCISYLTIELKGAIPLEFRRALGNRIYGCDDCQLVCPWNKFATRTREPGFAPRHALDRTPLAELFAWTPATFDDRLAGSAIRRIGHERWLRNIAVALGNAPSQPDVLAALESRRDDPSMLVREHVGWALAEHQSRSA
jgi:epoxyqueuosine reductase